MCAVTRLRRSRGRAKFLGADHRQQLELLMAVAAGRGGEDQQGLVLVEVVQHLAVHLEHAPGQPDVLGLQRLPAGAEEVSELVAVHAQRAAVTAGKLTRASRSASAQIRLADSRSAAAR